MTVTSGTVAAMLEYGWHISTLYFLFCLFGRYICKRFIGRCGQMWIVSPLRSMLAAFAC
jgi:hypothetical protein